MAPEHLRLFRDEAGQLVVEDLGSANGIYLNGSAQRLARIIVDGKQPIRIGRTLLRIREGSFAVAPERVGGPERRGWPIVLAAVLSVLLLGLSMSRLWLGQTSEVQPTTYLAPLLSLVVSVLAWAGLWALLSQSLLRYLPLSAQPPDHAHRRIRHIALRRCRPVRRLRSHVVDTDNL